MVGVDFLVVAGVGEGVGAGGSARSSCSRSAATSAAVIGAIPSPALTAEPRLSLPWVDVDGALCGVVVFEMDVVDFVACAVAVGAAIEVAGFQLASLHFSIELSPAAVACAYAATPLPAVSASAAARRLRS